MSAKCGSNVWMSPIVSITAETRVIVRELETTVKRLRPPTFEWYATVGVLSNLFESHKEWIS